MKIGWNKMSVAEFAGFERKQGQRIIEVKGVFWKRVRPFLYRPLLPFLEYVPHSVSAPWTAVFGGCQHAVPPRGESNSLLNLLLFEDAGAYSLDGLDYNRKRQVRLAAKRLIIRPIEDLGELVEQGHRVYVSFHDRTGYAYKAERRRREYFARWAESLFHNPKLLVLGGYRNGELEAVCVSQRVENTVLYSTFFCKDESLRLNVSDLMLHTVRQAAAECGQVSGIFAGMYKGGTGLDDFYLLRGASLVKKAKRCCT